MRHRRLVRILVAFVVAAITAGVMATSAAAAGPHRYQPPDLVAIGDSFAAGTGNVPYQPDDGECDRSASAASSELLARLRLVTLQAFRACQGAKTTDVIAQGQLTAITADTDVVTVQALGNDLGFGALVAYCLDAVPQNPGVTCHRNQVMLPLGGITVQQLLDSIPNRAPAALDGLYDAIDTRIDAVHAKAKVIAVDYGNPFPDPSGWVGPLCPYMDAEELGVATDFANGLNVALQQAAARHGFAFANAAPRFRGLDVCGFASAFYRPPGFPGAPSLPEGARGVLHPNKAGQGIYAAVLAGRLSF